MSEAPIDPKLASTYYMYVLIFFAAILALSVTKLLLRKGRGREAIR